MWPPGRTESTPLPWAPPLWPHRPGIHLLHCLQPSLSEEGTLYQPTPRLCPVPRVAHCSFLSRIELRSPLRFPLLPNQEDRAPTHRLRWGPRRRKMWEAYPGKSRASSPWRSPAPATARQTGAGKMGPCASPPTPGRYWATSGALGGCPTPHLPCSPATAKLSLAFPILMPLKSLGCG